jgi:hypothetical protein
MERKQFTFYRSFYEAMSEMNMAARGRAVTILCEYALQGEEPEQLKGALKMYWNLVQPTLRSSRKKALAGRVGAAVTNQSRHGKKENEIEKELEIELEHKCVGGDGFEKFWDLYPVKIAKNEAYAVWKEKMPDTQTVLKALEAWMRSKRWTKDGGNYIPRAGKFLEQEYYLQAPEVESGATGKPGAAELEAIARLMKEN